MIFDSRAQESEAVGHMALGGRGVWTEVSQVGHVMGLRNGLEAAWLTVGIRKQETGEEIKKQRGVHSGRAMKGQDLSFYAEEDEKPAHLQQSGLSKSMTKKETSQCPCLKN